MLGLVIDGSAGFKQHKTNILFKDSFINSFQVDENNLLKNRFRQNSVYDWTPKTKINIIHCLDDEIIPYEMATIAKNKFQSNGAINNITLSPIPTNMIADVNTSSPFEFVHANCGTTAYGVATSWFSKIRSGEIK